MLVEPLRTEQKPHQVTIQERGAGTSGRGQPSGAWANLAADPTIWVGIKPLSLRQVELANQVFSEATHLVEADYRSDLVKEQRLQFGSRYFYIGHVKDIEEQNVKLEMLVVEGDP
jgi:SPP1 family predicted phage head-tail adaptor